MYIYNTYTYTRQLLILPMHTIGSSALQWAEGPRRPKFVKLTEMSSFHYVVLKLQVLSERYRFPGTVLMGRPMTEEELIAAILGNLAISWNPRLSKRKIGPAIGLSLKLDGYWVIFDPKKCIFILRNANRIGKVFISLNG